MVNCTICGKYFKNRAGLSGHMQFKHGSSTINKPAPSPTYKPVQSDTSTSSLQKQVQALKDELQELKALKDQPVQQQHQPVTTAKQFLDEEKQKIADLKDEQELLELLKEQMDGTVSRDHEIMDKAPESIYDELKKHHLDLLC